MQICKRIETGHDPSAVRVVLQIIQHAVYLIELPFGILMLDAQLIAICLADAALFICPGIPDMAGKIVDIIGFFLPDPENLIQRRLEIDLADGLDGELFLEVIAVDNAK